MLTLSSIVVIIVCVAVIVFLYTISTGNQNHSPVDAFSKLQASEMKTIRAFTFSKTNDNKFENYFVGDEGVLEKSLDDLPVNYDGSYYKQLEHGDIIERETGFNITGIDFDFNCPQNWIYQNGKCFVDNICQLDDVNVYRGINYYYFSEKLLTRKFSEVAYHPRLYYLCNGGEEGELMKCESNELYVGLEETKDKPCRFYDICEDKMTTTKHKYQIRDGELLAENEYYICNNGVSVLQKCPPLTGYSTVIDACLPINRCLDLPSGTFPDLVSPESRFVVCSGGRENLVSCSNGIFESNSSFSCRNPECDTEQVIFRTLEYFQFPSGVSRCAPNENQRQNFQCSDMESFQLVEGKINVQSNLPYQIENSLFNAYYIPDKILDVNTMACIDFDIVLHNNFILNNIIQTSFNDGLPNFNYNVMTEKIDYSLTPLLYYKDGPSIRNSSTIDVHDSTQYAGFMPNSRIDIFEYVDDIQRSIGDLDYCIYAICCDMSSEIAFGRSSAGLDAFIDADGVTQIAPSGQMYNAYTQTFSSISEAHSLQGLEHLPFNESYIFQYSIITQYPNGTVDMFVWTLYGMVKMHAQIFDYCHVDDNMQISHETLPKTKDILSLLAPATPFDGILSNIQHQQFVYFHRPISLQWLESYEVLEPPLAIENIDKLFQFNHIYYKNVDLVIDSIPIVT